MATDNKEIEVLLNKMKAEKNPEGAQILTDALKDAKVYVPALMPKSTDPAILQKMMKNPGVPAPIPEGAQPTPCILQNPDGKKFFPVFTSEEEISKGTNIPKYPLTLNIPFKTCMDLIVANKEIAGAVLNPFNQNVILNITRNEPEQKQVRLTESQMHAVIRRKTELNLIPMKLFTEGEAFVNELVREEGECIMKFYEEPYAQFDNCPYTADDFDFMNLVISDILQLIRVTMPEAKRFPGTCVSVFVAWNSIDKTAKYYAIEKKTKEETDKLLQVKEDGSIDILGDAPSEGSELQAIIDIAQE